VARVQRTTGDKGNQKEGGDRNKADSEEIAKGRRQSRIPLRCGWLASELEKRKRGEEKRKRRSGKRRGRKNEQQGNVTRAFI